MQTISVSVVDERSQRHPDPDAAFARVALERDPALVETVQRLHARHGILHILRTFSVVYSTRHARLSRPPCIVLLLCRTDLKAPSMLHGILFVMKSAVSIIDLDWVIVNTILGDHHCRVQ